MKCYSYILPSLILSLGISSNTFADFSCKNAEQIKNGVNVSGVDASRARKNSDGSYSVFFNPYHDQDQLVTFSVDKIQASNQEEAIKNAQAILDSLELDVGNSKMIQSYPTDTLECEYFYTDLTTKRKIELGAFAWVGKNPN